MPLDKDLSVLIDRMSSKIEADAEINETVSKKAIWSPNALVPNQICRVSPFFPLGRKNRGRRDYLENEVIVENAWGRITFTGPRLTTYDEDILLAILATIDDPARRKMGKFYSMDSYMYQGSLLPIMRLAGLTDGAVNYKHFKKVCRDLMCSLIELETFKYVNEKKRTATVKITNMIMFYEEKDSGEYTIVINPFFHNLYIKGNFSLLDVERRIKIKSNIAKSLYRFIISQQSSWKGHYSTLADVINIKKEIENYKKRERLKNAISELIKLKILTAKSYIKKDIVYLERHPSTKSRRKTGSP